MTPYLGRYGKGSGVGPGGNDFWEGWEASVEVPGGRAWIGQFRLGESMGKVEVLTDYPNLG